ncbi:PEP-CTERM sorting domain-containing protein [Gloeocapsa sp. PCC 73106]|uniref:PEP-CTERM sorting domain-containing protein n=1 Tax=Gloeocapsa sp. PCC 73106 TaxID=102232 RepID=UPI0002AC6418|nr:PEP-CTERM sorting domain-containing protein [Gloeocapsa sp. PCC 73106]ELR98228.1 hypothetical protein GLO73106DRAFT_00020550 [Gloeocapsa sp. PCC 73106]
MTDNVLLKSIVSGAFLTVGSWLLSINTAEAATFRWSFSNVIGGINGTVSGTLEVPEGDSVAASSVILTSTSNPVFDSLVGFDFTTLSNFANSFNVSGNSITAAQFATDFFANTTNLNLELNSQEFGDDDSQNNGLITTAGNPLQGVCPGECIQTSQLLESNLGQTQFAPTFEPIPEPITILGSLTALGFATIMKSTKNNPAKR